jgi:hypothetical protein
MINDYKVQSQLGEVHFIEVNHANLFMTDLLRENQICQGNRTCLNSFVISENNRK